MKTIIPLFLLVGLSALAQAQVQLPANVWLHYQKLGTNLAAIDHKMYDLRSAHLVKMKEAGKLQFSTRITSHEYEDLVHELDKKYRVDVAPLTKQANALEDQRRDIETRYKFKGTYERLKMPTGENVGFRPSTTKPKPPAR